jgi:hypothetical protein
MEMVALILLGIATMAIIEQQKSAMERIIKSRREKDVSSKRRHRG